MDLQVYSTKVYVENESTACLVTLEGVDLSEIAGQVAIDEMLNEYDYADIQAYLIRRREEDAE